MAVYKVGDKYFNELQFVGTEQDIQAAGGVSANLPWWAKGSVSSIPTTIQTTQGGNVAPSLNWASQAAGISEAKVKALFDAAGFSGYTSQTPEQISQSIWQTDASQKTAQSQQQGQIPLTFKLVSGGGGQQLLTADATGTVQGQALTSQQAQQYLQQNPNAILDIAGSQNYLNTLGLSTANVGLQQPKVKEIFGSFFQQGASGQPILTSMVQQGGTLTDVQSLQQGQQQQQQIASGQQVQIGTSPTGVPLYAPAGSAATTNQLGVQQPQVQPQQQIQTQPQLSFQQFQQAFPQGTQQQYQNLIQSTQGQSSQQEIQSQQQAIQGLIAQGVTNPQEILNAMNEAARASGLSEKDIISTTPNLQKLINQTLQSRQQPQQQQVQPPQQGIQQPNPLQGLSYSQKRQLANTLGFPSYLGTPEQDAQIIAKFQGQQAPQQPQLQPQQQGQPGTQGAQQYQNLLSQTGLLRSGARGTEVSQLQQFLQSQGFNVGNIDGIFGSKTAEALKAFQQQAGIGVDAIVGPETRAKMRELLSGTEFKPSEDEIPALDLTPSQEEYSDFLQTKSYDDIFADFSTKLGLDALSAQLTEATKKLTELDNTQQDELQSVRDNPWISNELLGRKEANILKKYEAKRGIMAEEIQMAQKQYDSAREEAKFAAKMMVDQMNSDRQFALQATKFANELATQNKPSSVQEYEYARSQGYSGSFTDYQNEDANRKISIAKAGAVGTAGLSDKQMNTALKLSDDYEQRSKDYYQQRDAYNRIVASASNPSAAGDLALIFNYMKVLDPGSTVREGEFANAQNSGSAFNIVGAQYNKVLKGTRLTQIQRNDFVNRATAMFNGAKAQQDATVKEFTVRAGQYGVPTNLVVRETAATGNPIVSVIPGNTVQHQTFWSGLNNWLWGNQ